MAQPKYAAGLGSRENFAAASGRLTGALGLLVIAGVVVIDLVDFDSIPLPVLSGALLLGVLMWATMLRPLVWVRDGQLFLRNAFEKVTVPLASIEDLSVRQVLAVRTAKRRYVASGLGRTIRQAIRTRPAAATSEPLRPSVGAEFGGASPAQVEPGMAYADWAELRLRDLVQSDREQRGIRAYSEQADALADEVVRQRAVPELVALLATTVFFVVAVVAALA